MNRKFINEAEKLFWDPNTEEIWKKYYDGVYKDVLFDVRGTVLSIGEGKGYFLDWLGIKKATIVDLCKEESQYNYEIIKQDLTKKLNIKRKFETIFVMEVLEHLKNPLYLMAQVYDLLSEKGVCYVSIPYTPLNREDMENMISHKWRWKDHEIKRDLEMLGFNVKFLLKKSRFKNTAFFLPHCFLIMEITK